MLLSGILKGVRIKQWLKYESVRQVPLRSLVRLTVTSKPANVNYKGMSSPFKLSSCSQPRTAFVEGWRTVQKPNMLLVKVNPRDICSGLCFIPDFALWLLTYSPGLSQNFFQFGGSVLVKTKSQNFPWESHWRQGFSSYKDLGFAVYFVHENISKGHLQLSTFFIYHTGRIKIS